MWGMLAGMGIDFLGSAISSEGEIGAAKYNRSLLNQQAQMQEQAMERETELATKEGRKLKAEQYASYAKSGAVPTSGTPLLVMVEQAGDIQRDILENRRNRTIQADGLRHQGEVGVAQAKQKRTANMIGSVTRSLSGAASMIPSSTPKSTLLNSGKGSGSGLNYGSFNPQMNTISGIGRNKPFKYNF